MGEMGEWVIIIEWVNKIDEDPPGYKRHMWSRPGEKQRRVLSWPTRWSLVADSTDCTVEFRIIWNHINKNSVSSDESCEDGSEYV